MKEYKPLTGMGCPVLVTGLPEHNPKPTTARGKRREVKNPAAYNETRSTRKLKESDDSPTHRYEKM